MSKPKRATKKKPAAKKAEVKKPSTHKPIKRRTNEIHTTREGWLEAAVQEFKPWFKEQGHSVENVRVSTGFPKGRKAIGECWSPECATDKARHIFICPTLEEPTRVLDVLLHELCHAVLPHEVKHRKPFITLARALGLEGKPTATYVTEGSELHKKLEAIVLKLGDYPHNAMVKMMRGSKEKKGNGWIRLKSLNDEKYKIVIAGKVFDEHGAPVDPWGYKMIPNDAEGGDEGEE